MSRRNPQWKILIPVLLLLLFGLGLVLFDWERTLQILAQADWRSLPVGVLLVAVSYGLFSLSYVILASVVGIQMGRLQVGVSFFVSSVVNRVVRSGGAAGLSLRYWMMKPYGVSLEEVINSSILHFLLGSLVMLGMLPVVVVYILVRLPVSGAAQTALISLGVLGTGLGLGLTFMLFSQRPRRNAARLVTWLGRKIARRDLASSVEAYLRRTDWAMAALRRNWMGFGAVMLLLGGEWAANVLLLKACLGAFGPALSLGGAAAIYVVATLAGVATALPGGIGVQEALITSLGVLQGASLEQAALAALLYRILYTFLPYLLSIGFYPSVLKGVAARRGEAGGSE